MKSNFRYTRDDFYDEFTRPVAPEPKPRMPQGQGRPAAIQKMLAQRRLAQNKGRE